MFWNTKCLQTAQRGSSEDRAAAVLKLPYNVLLLNINGLNVSVLQTTGTQVMKSEYSEKRLEREFSLLVWQ